jgi:hypothetical protein
MEDSDIVHETIQAILAKHGEAPDISALTSAERNVLLVNQAHYLVGNGGFQFLFEREIPGDPDHQLMATAHAEVGAKRGAAAFEKALAGFLGIKPTSVIGRPFNRLRLTVSLTLALLGWDTSDTLYFESLDDTYAALGQYIRSNASQLDATLGTQHFGKRKNGPLLRQLDYIKTLLPAAMKEADEHTFSHLVTFDGYQLDEGNAIWILQTKNEDELLLDTEYSPIRVTAVTADGTIHPKYCKNFWPYTDVSPPYWLLAYIVEDRMRTTFRMVDEDGNQVGSVTIGEITTDQQLKQRNNSH